MLKNLNTSLMESDLVAQLREGRYDAFEQLYDKYAPQALQRIRKLVVIKAEAEEIFQELFMKIWEERERLPLDVPFEAIVARKARSLAYNFYRKASQDKMLHEQIMRTATALYDELEEYLSFKETNEQLQRAIAKLPEQRQRIFKRIKLDGKSYEETAEEFGISLSTVKDHMTRALKFLRTELANNYPSLLFLILSETLFK